MQLEEIEAMAAVADAGSFKAAASQLGISRTTLRRRVRSLEARTGVPLFDRRCSTRFSMPPRHREPGMARTVARSSTEPVDAEPQH
jgi:DNA-binding transcriptional LysR family regulator